MAIIIPSKDIYVSPQNEKILKNQINGISYTDYKYNELFYTWKSFGTISGTQIVNGDKTYYSEYLYSKDDERKRYKVTYTLTSIFNNIPQSSISFPETPNIEKTYVEGYIKDTSRSIYTSCGYFDNRLFRNIPRPIDSDTEHTEAINYIYDFFASRMFFYGVALPSSNNNTYIVKVDIPKYIYLSIETDEKIDGDWTKKTDSTVKTFSFDSTLYDAIWKQNASNITSENLIYGDLGNVDFALDDNELMRNEFEINGVPNSQTICKKIVEEYSEGKETVVFSCSISDYFDENGEKVISIDSEKMALDIYDEIIVMKYSENLDKPISTLSDGSPKKFSIIGTKLYYDGAVFQEITAQEILPKPRLIAPQISIDNKILTIADTNEQNVGGYIVYSDGEILTRTTEKTIDVSSYAINPQNTTIQVKVVSNNLDYWDSALSNGEIVKILEYKSYQLVYYACVGFLSGDKVRNFAKIANYINSIPVRRIGESAFANTELASITLGANITSIGNSAFANTPNLKSITLPNTITDIENNAFSNSGLTYVHLPNNLANIRSAVFTNCKYLTEIYIPKTVTQILDYAFYDCNSLETVYFGGTLSQWNLIAKGVGNTVLDNVKIYTNVSMS